MPPVGTGGSKVGVMGGCGPPVGTGGVSTGLVVGNCGSLDAAARSPVPIIPFGAGVGAAFGAELARWFWNHAPMRDWV